MIRESFCLLNRNRVAVGMLAATLFFLIQTFHTDPVVLEPFILYYIKESKQNRAKEAGNYNGQIKKDAREY